MRLSRVTLCQLALFTLAFGGTPLRAEAFRAAAPPNPCESSGDGTCGRSVGVSPLPIPSLVHPGRPIPANGGVLFSNPHAGTVSTFVATDGAGNEVAGEVLTPAPGFLVFQPSTDLIAGTVLQIRVSSLSTVTDHNVAVDSALVPMVAPDLQTSGEFQVYEVAERMCCAPDPSGISPAPTHCVDVASLRNPQMVFGSSLVMPAPSRTQYIYQYTESMRYVSNPPQHVHSATFEGEEVCMQVRALHITSLQETLYPEVCVVADVGPLRTEAPDLADNLALEFCHRPPFSLNSAWCSANEATCGGDPSPACVVFREVCLGQAPVGGSAAGTGGGPQAGSAAGGDPLFDGMAGASAQQEPIGEMPTHVRAGCGCRLAQDGSSRDLSPALIGLWLWAARRRKGRSAALAARRSA